MGPTFYQFSAKKRTSYLTEYKAYIHRFFAIKPSFHIGQCHESITSGTWAFNTEWSPPCLDLERGAQALKKTLHVDKYSKKVFYVEETLPPCLAQTPYCCYSPFLPFNKKKASMPCLCQNNGRIFSICVKTQTSTKRSNDILSSFSTLCKRKSGGICTHDSPPCAPDLTSLDLLSKKGVLNKCQRTDCTANCQAAITNNQRCTPICSSLIK